MTPIDGWWKRGKITTSTVLATPYSEKPVQTYQGSFEEAVDLENVADRARAAEELAKQKKAEKHRSVWDLLRVKQAKAALHAEEERLRRADQPKAMTLTPSESRRLRVAGYLGNDEVQRVMAQIEAEHNAGLST